MCPALCQALCPHFLEWLEQLELIPVEHLMQEIRVIWLVHRAYTEKFLTTVPEGMHGEKKEGSQSYI